MDEGNGVNGGPRTVYEVLCTLQAEDESYELLL